MYQQQTTTMTTNHPNKKNIFKFNPSVHILLVWMMKPISCIWGGKPFSHHCTNHTCNSSQTLLAICHTYTQLFHCCAPNSAFWRLSKFCVFFKIVCVYFCLYSSSWLTVWRLWRKSGHVLQMHHPAICSCLTRPLPNSATFFLYGSIHTLLRLLSSIVWTFLWCDACIYCGPLHFLWEEGLSSSESAGMY